MTEPGPNRDLAERTYQFADFELRVASGELVQGDTRIEVAPKVFDVLMFFVQNPGRLLTKREVLDRVWRGVHVGEGSLNRAVARLRAALGDKASSPRFVETVSRRGFRFIADVKEVVSEHRKARSSFQVQIGERTYVLHEGENILGRGEDCDVAVKSASISRHHAAITIALNSITIRDLGSKNGTFLRGRRIEDAVALTDRERIRLGSVEMTFCRAGAEQTTITISAVKTPFAE